MLTDFRADSESEAQTQDGALGGQTPYERLRQKTTLDLTRPRQSHSVGKGDLLNSRPSVSQNVIR
jgi:hypothetical protein